MTQSSVLGPQSSPSTAAASREVERVSAPGAPSLLGDFGGRLTRGLWPHSPAQAVSLLCVVPGVDQPSRPLDSAGPRRGRPKGALRRPTPLRAGGFDGAERDALKPTASRVLSNHVRATAGGNALLAQRGAEHFGAISNGRQRIRRYVPKKGSAGQQPVEMRRRDTTREEGHGNQRAIESVERPGRSNGLLATDRG